MLQLLPGIARSSMFICGASACTSPLSLTPPSFQVRAHLRRVSLSFLFANRGPLLPSFLRRVPFLGSLLSLLTGMAEDEAPRCVLMSQFV